MVDGHPPAVTFPPHPPTLVALGVGRGRGKQTCRTEFKSRLYSWW